MDLDNEYHVLRFAKEPPHPSYISGFIDGDGCIYIRKLKNGYQSGINIAQSRTNILQVLQYHFGGTIICCSNRCSNTTDVMESSGGYYYKFNKRNQYSLRISSNEYEMILNYIQNHVVIKQKQHDYLCQMYKLVDIPNKTEEKDVLFESCFALNKKTILDEVNLSKINIEYIAGLFDAEGCIYINKNNYNSFYISISQKNHKRVLQYIVEFMNYGALKGESYYIIYGIENCLHFLHQVKSHLIVKYNQAVAFEIFLTTQDFSKKEEMYRICNAEKHQNEIYNPELTPMDDKKKMFLAKVRHQNAKEEVFREIRRIGVYKDKSENMKGQSNHNYGKAFSEETKQKMSISIRDAKGGISDENILLVRQLLSKGKRIVDIQTQLGIARDIVSKIKNGNLICRTEVKQEKRKTTLQERNMQKRKITVDEMITVIDKVIQGVKPITILEEFEKVNPVTTITIDVIKNLKRGMGQNKIPFYENEVNPYKYFEYKEKIIQYYEKVVLMANSVVV